MDFFKNNYAFTTIMDIQGFLCHMLQPNNFLNVF
jgi:hypothetical protein